MPERFTRKHYSNLVFTFCDTKHTIVDYLYTWKTNSTGIPIVITQWCTENCKSDWGWWFDEQGMGIMGFFDRNEMVNAMLLHSDLVD